ncbi:hypothetical protein FB451DRAFT_77106 [Mycena latifolia]|nr:hypothetical protein FB451DRAFT_77106 [Mycena latifolia]
MTAQRRYRPSLRPRSVRVGRRERRESSTMECVLFSQTPHPCRRLVPSPSARPLPRVTGAGVLTRLSGRIVYPCITPRHRTSPRSHSYSYIPAVLPSAPPVLVRSFPSLSIRTRMRDRAVCTTYRLERSSSVHALFIIPPPRHAHCTAAHLRTPSSAVPPPFPARSGSAPLPSALTPPRTFPHTAHTSPRVLLNVFTRK